MTGPRGDRPRDLRLCGTTDQRRQFRTAQRQLPSLAPLSWRSQSTWNKFALAIARQMRQRPALSRHVASSPSESVPQAGATTDSETLLHSLPICAAGRPPSRAPRPISMSRPHRVSSSLLSDTLWAPLESPVIETTLGEPGRENGPACLLARPGPDLPTEVQPRVLSWCRRAVR